MIARNPLRGSGPAARPHPALVLGEDAHASQRIGMTDGRQRPPAMDETPHAVPPDAPILATTRQRAIPQASHLEPKENQRPSIHGYSIVADVSTHHCLQPLAQLRDGFMHAPLKLGFHLVQLRLQSFTDRLPQRRVHSVAPLLHADMREEEKVECLGLPFSTPLPVVDRKRTKFQQPRFLVHGVSGRAGLWHASRVRRTRCCLPLSPTASASRSNSLSRLNTRPHVPLSTLRRCSCEQLRVTRADVGRYFPLV